MLFFGTGALLMKLRQHALEANECHDLEVEAAKAASLLKTCCGGNTANNSAGGGVGANGDGAMVMASSGEDEDEKMSCKFCDEDAACRFCFAGPEKGELIAPCACVGSQVRNDATRRDARHFFCS